MPIEHPIGASTILVELGDGGEVESAAVLLTARKLFDGVVFVKS
jgi:4-oxalomesaconate tautomerase